MFKGLPVFKKLPKFQQSPMEWILSLLRSSASGQKRSDSNALTLAWVWLRAKYTISTTKRLRVSETISLGEKRFVAIVAVEGREFLIGGGTAGMSLLAQLGAEAGTAAGAGQEFGRSGGVL
ncbi:MAG: flagellar biosynthetic protein FliO [Acidobacteriaceae bacterium]